jgi:hypothetical protein
MATTVPPTSASYYGPFEVDEGALNELDIMIDDALPDLDRLRDARAESKARDEISRR